MPKMETKCCCISAALIFGLIVVGGGICTYMFSGSSTIVKGDDDFTDEHRSFIERLSLLSLSNTDSGSSSPWTWGLGLFVFAIVIIGSGYVYHRKVQLPRHRQSRANREQQNRQQEFILELMNRPVPT